jgi:C4-dicarboxylate transporter, DctM subunit
MDPTIIGLLGLMFLLLLVFAGLPIGFSLATVGFGGLVFLRGLDGALGVLSSVPYSSVANFLWTAVPLFILMGYLAFVGGIVTDLFLAAQRWLGWLPGGLCCAAIVGCAGFAAATGSSVACAAAIGKVSLPEMAKYGYDKKLSTGTLATAGTLGSLIPPSIFMIVYGMITETSVGKLFMAGIIPGIMSAVVYMIYIITRVSINPSLAPAYRGVTWAMRLESLKGILGISIITIVVLGGIYSGYCTPTEAAAVGSLATLILGLVRRKLTWPLIWDGLKETTRTTSTLFVIIMGSMVFVAFMAVSRIPDTVGTFIVSSGMSKWWVLIGICGLYYFLGCFMEPIGMMLLTLPIIFPTLKAMGFDPIWYGIVMVKLCEIGMITPPVGLNVYVINGILPDVSLEDIFKGIIPFVMVETLNLLLIILFPWISLYIPSLMG